MNEEGVADGRPIGVFLIWGTWRALTALAVLHGRTTGLKPSLRSRSAHTGVWTTRENAHS